MPDTPNPSRPNMGHLSTDDLTRELCERFAKQSDYASTAADGAEARSLHARRDAHNYREAQRTLDAKIAALTGTDRWANDAHDQITNNLGKVLADAEQDPVCDHCGKSVKAGRVYWAHTDSGEWECNLDILDSEHAEVNGRERVDGKQF